MPDDLTCPLCGKKDHVSREVNVSRYEVFCPDAGKWVVAKESQPFPNEPNPFDEMFDRK